MPVVKLLRALGRAVVPFRGRVFLRRHRPSQLRQWLAVVPLRDTFVARRLVDQRGGKGGEPVAVRVRPLGGREVLLRPGTSDAAVLADTFIGLHHLPPPEARSPRSILDLGANIGLTMAHYAESYPEATIVGVELDPDTAAIAERNIAPWADRCTLLVGAAWSRDEEVHFTRDLGEEWGTHVGQAGAASQTAQGYSLNGLVARFPDGVDLVKMDIEGGEATVLTEETDWAQHVRVVKIEVHEPMSVDDARRALADLGFEVRDDPLHPVGLVAVRPQPSAG